MSDEENILSRWSRRKREAAAEAADQPVAKVETGAGEAPAAPAAEPVAPLIDLETLPSLESITADADVRAFLTPGVPVELRREALRRAWSADPAIRDFIGLSENSWDFNDPAAAAAAAGFGPLQMTDDLRRALAQLFTPTEPAVADHGAIPSADSTGAAKEREETVGILHSSTDEISPPIEEIPPAQESSEAQTNIAAVQQQPAEEDAAPSIERRCHGRALPK